MPSVRPICMSDEKIEGSIRAGRAETRRGPAPLRAPAPLWGPLRVLLPWGLVKETGRRCALSLLCGCGNNSLANMGTTPESDGPCSSDSEDEDWEALEEEPVVEPLVALACSARRLPPIVEGAYQLRRPAQFRGGSVTSDASATLRYLGWRYRGTETLTLLRHLQDVQSLAQESLRRLRGRRRERAACERQVAVALRQLAAGPTADGLHRAAPLFNERCPLLALEVNCAGARQALVFRALRVRLAPLLAERVVHFECGPESRAALWARLYTNFGEGDARPLEGFGVAISPPDAAWRSEEEGEREAERRALTQHLDLAFRLRWRGAAGGAAKAVQTELLVSKAHWSRVLDQEMSRMDAGTRAQLVDGSTQRVTFPGRSRHFDVEELRRDARNQADRPARKRLKKKVGPALRDARRAMLQEPQEEAFRESLRALRREGGRRAARRLRAARAPLVYRFAMVRLWLLPDLGAARKPSPPVSFGKMREAAAKIVGAERAGERCLVCRLARLRRVRRMLAREERRIRVSAARHERRTHQLHCRGVKRFW